MNNKKHYDKALLAVLNIIIVAIIIITSFNYVGSQQKDEEIKSQNTFVTTVDSAKKIFEGYLVNQQELCNEWAVYINSQDMTVQQAVGYIKNSNSSTEIMGQIIDYDSMTGLSSNADVYGNYETDYSVLKSEFESLMNYVHTDKSLEALCITETYNNPVNNLPVVGFCQNVSLTEQNGIKKDYLLIRAVPLSLINEQSVFPTEYDDAEMSLINSDGSYVIRSESMKNESFWEYMRVYNYLGYSGIKELQTEFCSGKTQIKELNNFENKASYFVCLKAQGSTDLYYIGYIPKSSIIVSAPNLTLVYIIIAGVLLLILINGFFIIHVNKMLIRLNHEFETSIEQTNNANQAKTKFLSSMSHDIRTPMNAIVGLATIANKHVYEPEQIRDCLSKITLASNHLLTLVNDVLDISKIESGKLTLNPIVFSLSESVTNLVNIVRPQIKEKDLEFNVHIHKIEHEHIYADELRLNQIFINLLSNAVKYTDPKGSITIDLEEKIFAEDKSKITLRYTVTDTGTGMSEEFMKEMYNTFARAVDTRIDRIPGSGLGLAITKQMVDLMNGKIECESKIGVGTKFTVTLNLPIAENVTDDFVLPPLSMLVIDDDEVFLSTAKETLTSMGVTVDFTNSGSKAVEMVCERHDRGNDYNVIIIDWKMPEMNGVETTKIIRQKIGNYIPIIIISSYDWTEIEEDALAAGATSFINKPLFKSTVYSKINELMHFDNTPIVAVTDEAEDLKNLNLLIAEDNDLNWEIIEEILGFYDIKSVRAENGQICVDMLNDAPEDTFDAILMDIQMPVMNGKEASKTIRRLANKKKSDIPIIAMTADAFAEDVQDCIKAGMNGHVAKPVDIKKLFRALRTSVLSNSKSDLEN